MASSIAFSAPIKADAPQSYTVKRGDTLWGIAGMFLNEPWQWKSIWADNRQIKNPHLIYPGDQIYLENGKLMMRRGTAAPAQVRETRLKPGLREMPLDVGIPAISYDRIKSSFVHVDFRKKEEIKDLPYIVGTEQERIIGAKDRRVYINQELELGKVYNVYREGETFKAKRGARNKMIELGTELTKTAEVRIERNQDGLATAQVLMIENRGPQAGDRLILKERAYPAFYFEPKAAPAGTEAKIISMPRAIMSSAKGATVVLDRGLDAGLEAGDVLLAQTNPIYTKDPYTGQRVALPSEAVGTVMIYEVFDQVSLGIVMEAKDRVQVGTYAIAPSSGVSQ